MDLRSIPWQYQGSEGARVWRWESPHFVVTIIGEGMAFQWDVGDLVESQDGHPVPLADGRTTSFREAEAQVREVIGKAYSPTLGYRPYAGHLATTFTLASGEQVDFAQFHGTRVLVEVGMGEGRTTYLRGQAAIEHYVLVVATDTKELVRVQPHRIRSILHEHGGYDQMKAQTTLVPRMFHGTVTRNCTGVQGFLEGTVEHHAARCPVHEYDSLT